MPFCLARAMARCDGGVGVEVADASVAVPALDGAEGGGEGGFGVDVDAAVEDHGFEAGEAVEAVGVDAVAGGFGDEAGGEGGAVFAEAEAEHGAAEGFVEVGVGDSEHVGHCRVRKKTTAGPFGKLRAGSSTPQLAKCASCSAQDDTSVLLTGPISGAGLDPASVDDVALTGDGGAVVGGEEEEEAGDFFGKDVTLERLRGEDALFVGGRHVEAVLFFGQDGSGEDAVDADVEGAEFAREGTGHGDDGCLGHVVEGEVWGGDHPGDGAHVDDGALACGLHAGNDCLSGEELVGQVHGHALVPVFRGYFVDAVAVVAGCVVDEDVWGAECGGDVGDGGLEGWDVGEVAAAVEGWVGRAGSEVVD